MDEKKCISTTSNEVLIERVIPLIELLPKPILRVTRIGLQLVTITSFEILFYNLINKFQINLSWKFDDSVDQSSIKGYRLFLNTKPTETFLPNQYEYELRNLKPGTHNFCDEKHFICKNNSRCNQ